MRFALKRTARYLVALAILNIALISAFSLHLKAEFRESTVELRKDELERIVSIGLHSIQDYRDDYAAGLIDKDEALKLITDNVRHLTFGDTAHPNYIFMSSYDGTMLVQPFEPELEGTNQIDLRDADGKFIIRELIAQAKKEPGIVTYKYYPPDSDSATEKISFVSGIPEFDCYIGAGLYSIDIEETVRKNYTRLLISLLILAGILIGSAVVLLFPIFSSVQYIAGRFLKIGAGYKVETLQVDTNRYRKGSDAYKLVNGFAEITEKLGERNLELIKTTEDRELLVKEMNHRIKNNLQIIISLLRLQLQQTEDEEIRKSFLETISRLESISIIHSMLYSGNDFTSVSAEDYIVQLASYIIHSFGADSRIRIKHEFDDTKLSVDNAVNLGIITNEVITNTVKYAFPNDGEGIINIRLKSDSKGKSFCISDDGRGMPGSADEALKTGLGTNLIRSLSSQMEAQLSIDTENGTSYTIIW